MLDLENRSNLNLISREEPAQTGRTCEMPFTLIESWSSCRTLATMCRGNSIHIEPPIRECTNSIRREARIIIRIIITTSIGVRQISAISRAVFRPVWCPRWTLQPLYLGKSFHWMLSKKDLQEQEANVQPTIRSNRRGLPKLQKCEFYKQGCKRVQWRKANCRLSECGHRTFKRGWRRSSSCGTSWTRTALVLGRPP